LKSLAKFLMGDLVLVGLLTFGADTCMKSRSTNCTREHRSVVAVTLVQLHETMLLGLTFALIFNDVLVMVGLLNCPFFNS
jgi:hypothetical protein